MDSPTYNDLYTADIRDLPGMFRQTGQDILDEITSTKDGLVQYGKDVGDASTAWIDAMGNVAGDLSYPNIWEGIDTTEDLLSLLKGQETTFDGLRDAVAIMEYLGIDLNKVVDYIGKALGDIDLSGVAQWFGSLGDNIAGLFRDWDLSKTGDWLRGLVPDIDMSGMFNWVKGLFSGNGGGFLGNIGDWFKGLFSGSGGGGGFFGKVGDWLKGLFSGGEGGGFLDKIGGWFNDLFSGMDFKGIGDWFGSLFPDMDLSGIFGNIGKWFSGINWPDFSNLFGGGGGGNFFEKIGDFFRNASDAVGNIVKKIGDFDWSIVGTIVGHIEEVLGISIADTASDFVKHMGKSVKDMAKKLLPDLNDLSIESLSDYVKNFNGNLREGLAGLGQSAKDFGKQTWQDFKDNFVWEDAADRAIGVIQQYISDDDERTVPAFLKGLEGPVFGEGSAFDKVRNVLTGKVTGESLRMAGAGGGILPPDGDSGLLGIPSPDNAMGEGGVSMDKFCDSIVVQIDHADDQGAQDFAGKIAEALTKVFDDYGN